MTLLEKEAGIRNWSSGISVEENDFSRINIRCIGMSKLALQN